jgi:hypothetical protein
VGLRSRRRLVVHRIGLAAGELRTVQEVALRIVLAAVALHIGQEVHHIGREALRIVLAVGEHHIGFVVHRIGFVVHRIGFVAHRIGLAVGELRTVQEVALRIVLAAVALHIALEVHHIGQEALRIALGAGEPHTVLEDSFAEVGNHPEDIVGSALVGVVDNNLADLEGELNAFSMYSP